ncbi:putative vps9 domain protein [Eutypa lata UCREL1]|uniref:Putative vps9 domain protein n=1 Tax=Eutypa lata (strain UCR-EL1) TaxID=1287681 RepID=M7T2H9_EUTLA|nr:putative vps9 domain protein [Eutypa lata UCREL1]
MFQDFYHIAASHIQTHISSMATRQTRETPSTSRTSSAASILRAKAASLGSREKAKGTPTKEPEQQMLTAEEYADRKRARKALEQKKIILEEAVERRLCIGPTDLGVDVGELSSDDPDALVKRHDEISEYLTQARKDLTVMNEKRYPLGKLNYLKATHKSIVDTLSHFHPSSSADEIMPMLIYTLITMPPEKLNVISDANFIRRFRWEEKMEGETAYCLTNLEAAITFLDTVDLASLRSNEQASGQPKVEGDSATSRTETFPPAYTAGLSAATSSPASTATEGAAGLKPLPGITAQRRRLSDLIHTPAQAIGNAGDSLLNTADQGFKNIGASLGDSYKFLLGKLRDTSAEGKELVVPRTLDDARKLIGTPPLDDDGPTSGLVPVRESENPERTGPPREDKVLSLVGGKKTARDHSVDSARSGRSASSGKKVAFAEENRDATSSPVGTPPSGANAPLVESMRNLGNSLNPMNRFSGMSMMRGFSRPPPQQAAKDTSSKTVEGGDLSTAFPDIAAALPPKEIPKIKPPNKRFMELQNPADLKLSEVLELLRDYRRLATALRDMDAFKE